MHEFVEGKGRVRFPRIRRRKRIESRQLCSLSDRAEDEDGRVRGVSIAGWSSSSVDTDLLRLYHRVTDPGLEPRSEEWARERVHEQIGGQDGILQELQGFENFLARRRERRFRGKWIDPPSSYRTAFILPKIKFQVSVFSFFRCDFQDDRPTD